MRSLITFGVLASLTVAAHAAVMYKRSDIVAAYAKCPILGTLETGPDYLAYRDTLDACIWDVKHPVRRHG